MDTGPCSEAIASGTKIWCFLFAHDHEEAIYRYGPALFTIFLTTPRTDAPCMVIRLVYDLVNVLL